MKLLLNSIFLLGLLLSQCSTKKDIMTVGGILYSSGQPVSTAVAPETDRAVDAGTSTSNHLGNGCANLINRHNNPLWPQLAENVLAGAAHPLKKCVENMMRFTSCSLESAVHMASRNPARVLGLDDIGEIEEGRRANLISFTMQETEIKINKTYLDGTLVYRSE
jgi:hypothetical protein